MLDNQVEEYLKSLRQEAADGKPAGSFKPGAESLDARSVSPAKKELIRKMFKASGTSNIARDLLVKAGESSDKKIQRDADMAPAEKEKRLTQSRKYVELIKARLNLDDVYDPYVVAIADKTLSDEDLKYLIEFFENPAKQSVNNKFSDTIVEIIQVGTHTVVTRVLKTMYIGKVAEPK